MQELWLCLSWTSTTIHSSSLKARKEWHMAIVGEMIMGLGGTTVCCTLTVNEGTSGTVVKPGGRQLEKKGGDLPGHPL